jgi:hypothetical protein
MVTSPLQSSLFKNTAKRSRSNVIARLSRHGDSPALDRMFELSMTSTNMDEIPTIRVKHL